MYNVRVKRYLDTIQIRVYSDFIYNEKKLSKKKPEYNPFTEQLEILHTLEELQVREMRSKYNSRSRSINHIYDIARSNKWEWFFTLTFNPEKVDSFNHAECTKKLSKWLNNMRSCCPNMVYLVVPEQHKSGRWHFHGLFANVNELHFVDSGHKDNKGRVIYNVGNYRMGFSTATKIEDISRASSYLCKYITKDICELTKGKKRYWASRNVLLPEVYESIDNQKSILAEWIESATYIKTIKSEFLDVTYLEVPV